MLRFRFAIGLCAAGLYIPAADAAQMDVQHVQSEVVAVAWPLRRTSSRFLRIAVVAGFDSDLDFGQGHGPKIRDENYVPERLDSRNRNRTDAFDQRTLQLRIPVPLPFRAPIGTFLEIVDVGDLGIVFFL